MELKLNRTITTRLYTLGELSINGLKTTYTVEDTLTMLEGGIYKVRLRKGKSRRRVIAIIPGSPHKGGEQGKRMLITSDRSEGSHNSYGDGGPKAGGGLHHFEANGSYISSRKNLSVCIGEWLIPGSLKKGMEVYNRIFDRLEKAEGRNEPILLIITDDHVESAEPIPYWDQPSDHGCPPTKKRVELNEDDSVDIYDGNVHIRHLTVEEQRKLMHA